MKFKVFTATSKEKLEKQVNDWLETHPVSSDSMRFQFSAIAHDDNIEAITEYTLALFFSPRPIIEDHPIPIS